MIKRIMSCLTAMTIMLSAVSSVFATDNILEYNIVVEDIAIEPNSMIGVISGHIGYEDNIYWEFDESTGTLTFTGTGSIVYVNGARGLWSSYASKVKKVIIGEGITSTGQSSFKGCTNLAEVSLPKSLRTISGQSFYDCDSLTEITIPEGVKTIEAWAFQSSGLTSITIPDSVETIGYWAFLNTDIEWMSLPAKIPNIHERGLTIGSIGVVESKFKDVYFRCRKAEVENGILYTMVANNNKMHICDTNLHYLEELQIEPIEDQYYYGSAVEPEMTVKHVFLEDDTENVLIEDTDYTILYENNDRVGTATVTVKGIGEYDGEIHTASFNILNGMASEFSIGVVDDCWYNGEEQEPSVIVMNGSTPLSIDEDYTISYENNVDAGTATAIITGNGNFTGTKEKTFNINPIDINDTDIADIETQDYTGGEIKPGVSISYNGMTLTEGIDYTLTYQSNSSVGIANVMITGKGNFIGVAHKNFDIQSTSNGIWNYEGEIYYNFGLEPSHSSRNVTVTAPNGKMFKGEEVYNSTYWLEPSSEYSVGESMLLCVKEFNTDNINAENGFDPTFYSNSFDYFVVINPLELDESWLIDGRLSTSIGECGGDSDGEYNDRLPSVEYTGSTIEPTVLGMHFDYDMDKSPQRSDYNVRYYNNKDVGTATMYISFKNNLVGSMAIDYEITQADISNVTVEILPDVTYTGYVFEPKPTLVYNGMTLYEGTDYTLSYENNIEAGWGKVIVTGIGNFTGTKELEFLINYKDINDDVKAVVNGYYMYNGTAVEPTDLTVTYAGYEFVLGEDYEIVGYLDNNEVGTGTVYIESCGSLCFEQYVDFEINEYKPWLETSVDITGVSITYDTGNSLTYSGYEQQPEKFEIKYTYIDTLGESKTYTLLEGVDYVVIDYENNVNAGVASVIVSGLGGFYGDLSVPYTIKPMSADNLIVYSPNNCTYTGNAIMPDVDICF